MVQYTDRVVKILSNRAVDITKWVDISEEEAKELGVNRVCILSCSCTDSC